MAATQGGAAAAGTHWPPLVTVTNHVALEPRYLFMCTNSLSTFKNESLFRDPDGDLVYRSELHRSAAARVRGGGCCCLASMSW
jgi:hypothetical protein